MKDKAKKEQILKMQGWCSYKNVRVSIDPKGVYLETGPEGLEYCFNMLPWDVVKKYARSGGFLYNVSMLIGKKRGYVA